ncbi:helix-turn-helix transcriptional regulator [Pedobacter steynii]|uniref:Uncharacterized protein n=1 Tax=Pedobacter steynii TaxID=430522 RepID=A0A1D7QLJ3_9SPHI|nr:WYL domain-containing protein [Pedobacter steynii]AOM79489.1 hypothetical protein BFS30_21400 [Pedobacter steynii]
MSQNKQPIARIRVINECLSRGGYWSKTRLISEISKIDLNVSSRTLDNDISLMKDCAQLKYNAPIKYCRANKGYFYTDSNYSIDKLPLNQTDIKALEVAATTLKQYQYIPIMKEFTTTIDKIIRVVNRAKQSNHESMLDFIEFEKTPIAQGLEFIDKIINAIQNKKALNITYQKFGHEVSNSQTIHPYFLKEYRNRWYVIAFNETKNKIRTYGLDRIKILIETGSPYIDNTTIDTKEYLSNCIGINIMDKKINIVRLHFTPKEGNYIKTQPLHKSQEIIEDSLDCGLILEYKLIINYELIGIILSYGSDVKVIQPKFLADKIAEISKRTLEQYLSP